MLFSKAFHNQLLPVSLTTSTTPCLAHQALVALALECFHLRAFLIAFLCRRCYGLGVPHILRVLTRYGKFLS